MSNGRKLFARVCACRVFMAVERGDAVGLMRINGVVRCAAGWTFIESLGKSRCSGM